VGIRLDDVLQGTEWTLFEILTSLENGPVIHRDHLEELAALYGVDQSTLASYARSSPSLVRFAHAIYGLVGTAPPVNRDYSGSIETAYQHDGEIVLNMRLLEPAVERGQFRLPPGFDLRLEGQYRLIAEDGTRVGTLHLSADAHGSGLEEFIHSAAAEVGDHIRLVIDPERCLARIYLDGPEPNDEM
jgi:hypothetical protein